MILQRTRVLFLFVAGCAAQALAQAPAAAPEWPKVVAAANKEGRVMLYSLQSPGSVDRVVSGFRKAYPEIAVQYLRSAAGRMGARLDRERASGSEDGADVWINSEPAWLKERSREGHLLRLVGPAVAGWPTRYLSENSDFAVGGMEPQAIAYNKRLLERPPRTFAELIRAEYRDMIGVPEPTFGTIAAWYEWLEKSEGAEYLPKLKTQNPKLYNNIGALMEALASGEIALAALSAPALVKPLIAQGAPIDYVVPDQTSAIPLFVAAMGWSKKPNAALVLADFFLSREGQAAWHGLGDSASPIPGVAGAVPQGSATVLDPSAYSRASLVAYRERWNKVFK